jgi:hypothetical protein
MCCTGYCLVCVSIIETQCCWSLTRDSLSPPDWILNGKSCRTPAVLYNTYVCLALRDPLVVRTYNRLYVARRDGYMVSGFFMSKLY